MLAAPIATPTCHIHTNAVQTPYNFGMAHMNIKESRFEMRLTQEQRDRFNQAAATKGLSTSQWALSNLLEAAEKDIQEARTLYLDDEAWADFTAALDMPMPAAMRDLLESEPIWR